MFILWMIIGYVLAVIFPVPGISQAIINLWDKVGIYIGTKKTPAP